MLTIKATGCRARAVTMAAASSCSAATAQGDREHFRSVEAVGHVEHPYSRRDEHFDIFLCREFTGNLQRAWSELKKYD